MNKLSAPTPIDADKGGAHQERSVATPDDGSPRTPERSAASVLKDRTHIGAAATSPSSVTPVALRAIDLKKHFENGAIRAVDGVSFEIASGEMAAVVGPSGCGKSTLLNLIAAMDRPDSGELTVFGQSLSKLSPRQIDDFRARTIGFVFQLHNLLPHLTAHENIQVAMLGRPGSPRERARRAAELLDRVGLADRMRNLPTKLSGGERQRVAVARALANRPRLLLADEPTGALDSRTGRQVLELMRRLQREEGVTLLIVTHDPQVAEAASRVIHMRDGRLEWPNVSNQSDGTAVR